MKAKKDYLPFAHPGPRSDVYLQFLYAIFRSIPAGTARDDAVFKIFADDSFKYVLV